MKNNRVGPVFLMISLFLEALYLFQPLADSGLNQMFQSFQRMGIDAFDTKSILPLMIYIFVVKLSFLWRIPFLIYGFLWVKAIAKDSRGTAFEFTAGEHIHTESSHKYTISEFRELCARAGYRPVASWTDPQDLFSVHYFTAE